MKIVASLLAIPLAALITVGMALYEAWAVRLLWAWYIVPRFSVTPLSYPEAVGISLLVGLMTHQTVHEPKEKANNYHWVGALLRPAVCAGIGYLFL